MKKIFLVCLILSSIATASALQPRRQPQPPRQAFLDRLQSLEFTPEYYSANQRAAIRQEWESVRNQFGLQEQIRINTRVKRLATTAAGILGS